LRDAEDDVGGLETATFFLRPDVEA
jgi:hypothetical protein